MDKTPEVVLKFRGATALIAFRTRASVKYLFVVPSATSFVVNTTLGPAKPLILDTETGVANAIQFDKVVAACNFALIARVGVIRLEQAAARCVRCSQGALCHCRQPCRDAFCKRTN